MAHDVLKALCEKHPDMKFTRQDSYDAGNCEEGTKNFLDYYFPHRRVVRVKELIRFIDENSYVRRVLIFKLRHLSPENEAILADY